MQIFKVLPQNFGCNSYIVTSDGKYAVVIDCADEGVFYECERRGLTPAAVLLTHGHFDHVGGCGIFFSHGVPIYCGEKEKDFIFSRENRSVFGGVYIPEFEIYKTLKDGEKITLGGIDFEVIETVGHTVGGVCYLCGDCLFSGDTLFRGSVGRYDLFGGNFNELTKSIKKLFALDGDLKVYCGHEGETTLEYERKNNPYVKY
ncbi:MAG: MBL fold metallo-hydrolase [Clostridia bacterium]|nr:MBL fold metallo-hydrolase [Clostridia bacterium]